MDHNDAQQYHDNEIPEETGESMARSKSPNSDNSQRFQCELSTEMMALLDDLQRRVDATSRIEVIRNAIRFYDWMEKELAKGGKLFIRHGEEERGLLMPTMFPSAK